MMWHLILSNLRQRPTRTCVNIMAVSLGVVLVLVSVGLSYGQLLDQAERTRRIGGDFMLQPPDASFFLALNSGAMDVRIGQVIEKVDGVEASTPIMVKVVSRNFFAVFGVEAASFQRVNDGLKFVQGRFFETGDEAVVDELYASNNDVEVGQDIDLLGHRFKITGIYQRGTAGRAMIPLETLQRINGTPGKCSVFFIRAEEGRSRDEVRTALETRFENYKVTATENLEQLFTSTTPVFREFLLVIVALAVAMSFLVTLTATYSTIVERTREIGILKSLGASKTYIVRLFLEESLLVSVLGLVSGFLLTWGVLSLIAVKFPSLPVIIQPLWRVAVVGISMGGTVLGALYPAWKAAKLDPVTALGYE